MDDEQFRKQILRRLDVLILLMLNASTDADQISIAERVRNLTDLGLSPSEIASVIGKPVNHVTSILNKAKRRSR
jgi:hypothetical protein